jgi:hypothetical protein
MITIALRQYMGSPPGLVRSMTMITIALRQYMGSPSGLVRSMTMITIALWDDNIHTSMLYHGISSTYLHPSYQRPWQNWAHKT